MTATTDTDAPIEKLLPCSIEAEMGVLGCILIDATQLAVVMSHLQPADFYSEAHRTIYAAMLDVRASGRPVDYVTLGDELAKLGSLDDIGGYSYLGSLTNQVPTSLHAEYYARIVADKALCRRVIAFAEQIAAIAYNEADVDAIIETGEVLWQDAILRRGGQDSADIGAVIDRFIEQTEQSIETGVIPGVMTGFAALDAHLMGIKPGELVYLPGRPGSGKSAIAATIATSVAINHGAVEWVSLEMSDIQQAKRIITAWGEIDGRVIRANFRRPDDSIDYDAFERVKQTALQVRKALAGKLRLYDKPLSIKRLRSHAQRAVYTRGCKLLIVDYLGLVDSDDPRTKEYERVTLISRELKRLALELNIPILCLVQMNRESEKRQNKRPMLSDMRDSGDLEQAADVVIGVYRGAYYDRAPVDKDTYFAQFGELLVLKVREGVANVTIPFRFEGEYTRPSDWPVEWPYEAYLAIGK